MKNELVSISEIIKQGWELYIANLQNFLLPIALMLILPIIITILEYYNYFNLILFIFILTISIFISLWISVFLIELINKTHNKEKFDIKNLYNIAFQKIPSYLWVSFLTGLATILGLFLLIIPFIIFSVWFAFAPYINVLENKNNKGWLALKNSRELVRGYWGKTFWRLLLPPLFVYLIVMIIIIGLTYAMTGGEVDLATPNSSANLILNGLTTVIFSFLSPLFIAFVIILYNNLKQVKSRQNKKSA
ncbi:MAG: hypothetical protein GF365_03055 [Candidatus Buchananbacteria bacterium]|nr:hypothetical protein [Candidatus Buchananbacteria bacterium]